MAYLYLVLAMTASAILSIMSSMFGRFNKTEENTSYLYSAVVTFSATTTWGLICFTNSEVNSGVVPYSVAYGLFYTIAMLGMFKAYQTGSVSLTAFVKQLSLIAVAFWGFIFWGNPIELNIILGIALIIVALYLCFNPSKNNQSGGITLKWCIFALMLLTGNAGCSIIQKYQQLAFDGNFGNTLMFFGTLISFIISLMLYLKGKGCTFKDISPKTIVFPIIGGISSALLNLLILLLISSPLSESIIFPGIAVGGLVITTLFSVIVYKEKLKSIQWIGLFIGTIAIVLLNL